jgi:hypothetical protein
MTPERPWLILEQHRWLKRSDLEPDAGVGPLGRPRFAGARITAGAGRRTWGVSL